MSKIKSFIALLLLLITGSIHADDNISVASVTLTPGEVSDVIINCEFTSENITLYQFDLYLPDGVTLAKNAKGRYAAGTTYVLSDRHDEHTVSIAEREGFYRFVVSNSSLYTIAPGSGELLRLKVVADNTVSGTQNGSVKKFSMFETDETEHAMADVNFELKAPAPPEPVTDNISVASVTLTPGEVSDVIINCEFTSENITLYQFDLYLPDGVTLAKNAKGRYAAGTTYVLSDRHDEHTVSIAEREGFYRFVVSNSSLYTIAPGSGELLRLKVVADNTVSGTLNGSIKKFSMFETDETEHAMADVNFDLTVAEVQVLATSVALNKTETTLEVAVQEQLTATVLPEDATNKAVTWTTSDPTVATVDENGLVTAVATGVATITATTTDGTNLEANCAVTVIQLATSVALNKTEATIEVGVQEQLTATVLPEDATNKAVIWTTSDPTVATVDENGLVTAVAAGTATITATTTDGTNLEASCAVTVAPEEIYIETDVTSQFPTDFQGWSGATGYTPTQFAPAVTTNDGRTVQVCEKYNGSVAAEGVVFNRVLTGLTNGTYRIELYGAAASTKGRDTGIDSDMTEADDGDMTAVYLYAKTAGATTSQARVSADAAGNLPPVTADAVVKQYIPVHWATSFSEVATAVLNNVVVTDGTVEIGMYSEKKFTNWEVIQIKGVTAMVDAEEMHANTLTRAQSALDDEAYVNVTGEERTALTQAIADNTTVTEQTAEAYQAAINALDGATKTFTEAKAAYDGLVAGKTLVEGRSYPYATEAKKYAAEDAAAVVATSAADAVSKTDALLTAYRQYAESSALMEGIEGAMDVTATYIRNPKAEEAIDANVWQTVLGEGSGGSIGILGNEPWTDGSGSTSHKYFDGGNWGASAWDVTFKQDITLPAGRYQLTAIGRSSQDVALTLIGGEATADMAHIGAAGGLFNRGWEQTSLEFELMQEATVSIGVRGVTNLIHNWMSFSDFRLAQFPSSMTAIGEIKTGTETEAGSNTPIYDVMGRRLQKKPESGYYIQGGKTYFVK